MTENKKSLYARALGKRSLFSIVFGKFFEIKNNTAGIIAAALVLTLCFVIISKIDLIKDLDKILEGVLNIIFVVVGYYFGTKQPTVTDTDEEG
jgi:hypothetical protein